MADTDTEIIPNGTATLTEEEEERLKQRPADIDADVREMERRKRVEALMSSKLFREELERVLDQQIHEGGDAPLLQRIREMVGGRLHSGSLRGPTCVLPINDIRGIEGVGYEKGEKILRCKLAAVYRLVDLFGWTQTGANGQITARLNTAVEQVLTTPRGLLPHEVTASSLVKVDMQGVIQDQGTTNFPVNVEGFSLHAAVHAARPDIRCVLHVRSASALAVSSMQRGLLPLCHEAAALGEHAIHRVPLGILDNEEKDKLVRALGPHSKVLLLSNAGALCCGATLEEAFYHARLLTAAADVQLRLASIPLEQLSLIDEQTRKQIYDASHQPPADATKWRVGGEEFEGLMRMLDNAGFRTGYIYRHPLIKNDVPKPKNDVEVPPAVSSLGYLLEEEELYRQGLWKKGQGKTGERTRWLNSPNVYQKVEVLETGTTDPKKITKWVDANNDEWVQDGSPAHSSTPVKIDTLQFVPKNTNPKEFKKLQQQIKDNRRADKISAGPQSHILEGVTWDEASKLVTEDAANTHTGDHVVLMGAASKGIIQRGYQHNATMYSAPYARNPFDHVTDTEIEDYRRAVERKGKNEYDTDLSESEAISGAQITSPASAPSETEEESRDEHRVLRIETTQAPVRSQPEVVLSDVDTTDFLNAERAHADRIKDTRDPTPFSDDDVFLPSAVKSGVHSVITARAHHRVVGRDPNLLSDDEVFLDSAASTVTSSMSGMTSQVTSPQPTAHVVIRAQTTAIPQHVRGTEEANQQKEELSANKRSVHEYTRSANFDNIIKIYESPNKNNDHKASHPKCKVSLHSRLNDNAVEPLASSRSSLYSIPSIEWDGKAKSDYCFRTRSLPRQTAKDSDRLFRTRSHSGFINSYIKDPEPRHYHLPRCRSCGAANASYSWELTKEEKKKPQVRASLYFSLDNIPHKCSEEAEAVKVKQKVVPVLKVESVPEFVESQEFTEDNYLGELGSSFSSENQTVIERKNEDKDVDLTISNDKIEKDFESENNDGDIYRAECAQVDPTDDPNNTLETIEGEYHSFTDDFEEAYESPVKDLVEKDIRDYSVPINFYCDDYVRKNEPSPKKSPHKAREASMTVLEPILEESKSSYGDDSGPLSNNDSNQNSDVQAIAEAIIENVLHAAVATIELKVVQKKLAEVIIESTSIDNENKTEENLLTQNEAPIKVSEEKVCYEQNNEKVVTAVIETASTGDNDKSKLLIMDCERQSSIEYSMASSTNELVTLDSTVEFEKYEAITEFLVSVLNKINYDKVHTDFFFEIEKRSKEMHNEVKDFKEIEGHEINATDNKEERTMLYSIDREKDKDQKVDNEMKEPRTTDNFQETKKSEIPVNGNDTPPSDENSDDTFSITKLISDIESSTTNLNETILTESDSGITEAFKIAESVVYYIFDRVFFLSNSKTKKRNLKNVVTVVDPEDIMYTAQILWATDDDILDVDESKNDLGDDNEKDIHTNYQECTYRDIQSKPGDNVYEDLIEIKCSSIGNVEPEDTDNVGNYANVDTENDERNVLYNVFDFLNEAAEGDYNNNIEEMTDQHGVGENNIDYNAREDLSDDEDCRECSKNSTEIAGDIIYKIYDGIDENYLSRDAVFEAYNSEIDLNYTFIEHNDDMQQIDMKRSANNQISNDTCKDLNINCVDIHEALDETFQDTDVSHENLNLGQVLDETFAINTDKLNMAFVADVHTSSSPQKGSKAFESCTESPIRNPNSSFLGQDLTVLYENNDTLLGSPFVKRASVISMSQTENSGGIKYWLSFDDSIANDRSFTGSINDRVWKKTKRADDTIPSFYGVEFRDDSIESERNETFPSYRKMSVLVSDTLPKTIRSETNSTENKYNENEELQRMKDGGVLDISPEIEALTSPSSSKFYETCETIQDWESPQKKLLYEVHRRERLYSTWPPYEDTIFYRIISKFRMSQSFDVSDLDSAKIHFL